MNISQLISDNTTAKSKTALIFGDQKLTYSDLDDQIRRCAQSLLDRGVKKGDPFGLVIRNSPEFIIFCFALARIGAVAVPINFLEKADRIALILKDAGAIGVLTAREFFRTVKTAAKLTPSIKHIFLRDDTKEGTTPFSDLLQANPSESDPAASEDDLMMLLYTSGTTGLPKGVMLSHKNFLSNLDQCLKAIKIKESDRFLCLLPMFHAFAWTTCVLVPLKLGCPIVIIETLLPFDPVIKSIWKHKTTIFVAVPQIYSALCTKIRGAKALVIRLLNPIRMGISGAAPLAPAIHNQFEKTFGIPLLEGYGLTETSPVSSLNPEDKRKPGTVGKPLPGVELEIRDENGAVLSQGSVGEIWIRGPHVMKGYYKNPKETKLSLTEEGWLKTGDLGSLDEENYLTIADRKKDLIIVKGLNVYPQEVENVLIQNEAVAEVAVVGKRDVNSGEEIVRAFVTAKEGMEINKSDLFVLARNQLAAYKRPREIIILDKMPKNALQKILKKDLRNY